MMDVGKHMYVLVHTYIQLVSGIIGRLVSDIY